MRILLVEDDSAIAAVLQKALTHENYAVDIANDGHTGWQMVMGFRYELVILDVVLPNLDGLAFCQRLRDRGYHMPVLLVTALNSSTKKVAGLNAGADDYITKPFELNELLAKVRALLRRVSTAVSLTLEWDALQLNTNNREVSYQGNSLSLTPKEYALLELFLRNPSQVFSRRAILDNLWRESEAPGEETVTSHIKGLRRKLSQAGAPAVFLETVYGVGYRLNPLTQSPQSAQQGTHTAPATTSATGATSTTEAIAEELRRQKTKAALATLWTSVKYQQIKRLNLLKQMLRQLQTGQPSVESRHNAYQAAHSLTGVLGIFGLMAGSELTQEMQAILKGENAIGPKSQHQLSDLIESLETMLNQEIQPRSPAHQHTHLPLLVLVDPKLGLTPILIRTLWEKGLTVKALAHLNALSNLLRELNNKQREEKNREASTTSTQTSKQQTSNTSQTEEGRQRTIRRLEMPYGVPDVVILNFSFSESNDGHIAQLSGLVQDRPALLMLICSADDTLTSRVKAAQLGNYPFLYDPVVRGVVKGIEQLHQPATEDLLSQSAHPNRRILVVDDDQQILAALKHRLEPEGFHLITLSQPVEFWHTLEKENPDLLLLDISMPEFNGIELCQVVRQAPLWNHLPVVFFTSHTNEHIQQEAFRAGADGLIQKSSPDQELLTHLHNQLNRAHLQQVIA